MEEIFNISDELFNIIKSKYNRSNCIKYSNGLRFFIPPELVVDKSSSNYLIDTNVRDDFHNQLSNWVSYRRLINWLENCCNMRLQQYADIVLFHYRYISDRPKCKICGKNIEFDDFNLRYGYFNIKGDCICSNECLEIYKESFNNDKIIPWLTDEEFNNLISKYSWKDIARETEYERSWYYFIPPELLIHTISGDEGWITDPNDKSALNINVVTCKSINPELWYKCGIENQDFYDTFYLNIQHKKDRPRCTNPDCNKYLDFVYLRGGYGMHMPEHECLNFCSQHCKQVYYTNIGDCGFKLTNKKIYINRGNPWDICYLYIAIVDGYLKFGVTIDLNQRIKMGSSLHGQNFLTIHQIHKSTRVDIAELEDRIKSHFGMNEYLEVSQLHHLMDVIRYERERSQRKRILIFSVHPDDSCLSFSGLINKNVNKGNIVREVEFAVGGPASNVPAVVRKKEFEDVMEYCHMTEYRIALENMDGRLDTIPSCELTRIMDEEISKFKPDEVYCTPNSEHSDHASLYKAFLGACRLRSGHMPRLFAVGTYMFSNQLYNMPEGGKIYQPLSKKMFNHKCEEFKLYKSQCKPSPSPLGIEGIETFSKFHGMMCGCEYAELYYQLRYIRDHE